jgi:hypothetical protein
MSSRIISAGDNDLTEDIAGLPGKYEGVIRGVIGFAQKLLNLTRYQKREP